MRRHVGFVVGLLIALSLIPHDVAASTITLSDTIRGWYMANGSANGATAGNNYFAGDCLVFSCSGADSRDFRNWFEFDLSGLSNPITSATLLLDNPSNGFNSTSDASETYSLFDIAPGNVASLGANSLAIWADLGSGSAYGSYIATIADDGKTVSIALNANALAAINAALGGQFALGGAITTLNAVADNEYLFGFTTPNLFHSQLQLTDAGPSTVPEPTSLLLLTTGLTSLVARKRMRRRR